MSCCFSGNTLLREHDWHEAHRRRVEGLLHAARETGARIGRAEAGAAFDRAWQRHIDLWEQGVASGARDVAGWAMHELGALTHGASFELLVAHFENPSHSSAVLPVPGAVETVERLVAAGVRCALICDTGMTPGRVVREHLARLGMIPGHRAQLFSDEVGVPKPPSPAHWTPPSMGRSWSTSSMRRPNTPLLAAARARGLPSLGGLPMLVFQGALAFELWTGVTAPIQVMLDAALQALAEREGSVPGQTR